MENFEKLKEALNQNTKIDIPVKRDLLYTIEQFYLRFPNTSLEGLCQKLKTLDVVPGSMYLYTDAMQYVPLLNEIAINQRKLISENIDGKHAMMKSLIEMITSKDNTFGFSNHDLEALNIGFCEIVANNLVTNDGESEYEDEQRLVNLIFTADDYDILMDSFFKNDSESVMKLLLTKCKEPDRVKTFLSLANHHLYTKKTSSNSYLKEHENDNMNLDVTKEMMELIKIASEIFDVNIDYVITKPVGLAPLKTNGFIDYDEIHQSVVDQEMEWRRSGK